MNRLFIVAFALVAVAAAGPLNSLDWRIVGGSDAEDGQFPYQVSLRLYGSHSCGGSIINAKTILTAAHCVLGQWPFTLTVVVGTNKLNSGGKSYKVADAIYHPDWSSWQLINDVAVVILAEELEFNEKVQPIEINTENFGSGEDLIISGWGSTSYPGSSPNNLQWLRLKSLSTAECQSRHSNKIYDSEICTYTKPGEGICQGDSGGPLTWNGKVAGIVSWGYPCADGYPDVFTRVSSFADWIQENSA